MGGIGGGDGMGEGRADGAAGSGEQNTLVREALAGDARRGRGKAGERLPERIAIVGGGGGRHLLMTLSIASWLFGWVGFFCECVVWTKAVVCR